MPVGNSVLRQIRQDFMTLPFQATECYLANIKPSGKIYFQPLVCFYLTAECYLTVMFNQFKVNLENGVMKPLG